MVSKIIVDLNAKHVADDLTVWRLFPGKFYKFLPTFLEASLIFLDFPGLRLPTTSLQSKNALLRERVLASKEVSDWLERRRQFDLKAEGGSPPSPPERRIETYSSHDGYDGLPGDLAAVRKFFSTAKKGDLVLIPDRGRTRKFHIGELTEEPTERVSIDLGKGYYGEQTLARPIKWFGAVDEVRIPIGLSQVLRTQNTLIQVPSEYHPIICDVAYGSYIRGTDFATRFETMAAEFSDQDTLDLGLLVKLATSVASDIRHGKTLKVNISDFIGQSIPDEDRVSLSININSPGFLSARAATLAPLIFSALFTVFLMGDANAQPASVPVTIVNSASPDDACVPEVDAAVADVMKNMLFKEWKGHCARATRLSQEPRLRSDSRGTKR